MKIGGLQKVSLIDFPGKIATAVFTRGCNFRCQFCHNESLVLPEKFEKPLDENEVLHFLGTRVGKIDGVVVSGGEPTLQTDLAEFLEKIKNLGLLTKLDTNGALPHVLENLYARNLLDYVAMDIKHRLENYEEITSVCVDSGKIKQSIALIKNSSVDYEFRTTIVPQFHTTEDIKAMAVQLAGAKKFVIQQFVADHAMNKNLSSENSIFRPENGAILTEVAEFCRKYVGEFSWRMAT
ncbi:MAG: anaerobic ribonucleoside-triphosphate reductase activating protein [Puniceicoccales bacterium]|jgi:pyruvate formate lyase activating enzyme|nr:anaerobic ribonucleoside-triphosphate reductase activating protein [Puniceicoccales bacterium]